MGSYEALRSLFLAGKEKQLAQVRADVAARHIHGASKTLDIDGHSHEVRWFAPREPGMPLYVDIHGGGFAWGMKEEGDLYDHRISELLGWTVVAPDYPLAPEHPYPEGLEWLYETIAYLHAHATEYGFDPNRIVVGGRSAGGNLAASLTFLARERGEFGFVAQVLDHPYLDVAGTVVDDATRPSGAGTLSPQALQAIALFYAPEELRVLPTVSPLAASIDELCGLPPAVIQTCGLDSLRPDGDLYAQRLARAGVQVIHHCFEGVPHGFTEFENPQQEAGIRWLIDAFGQLVG